MWYDETIKNMAFQRDKVLGSCMTEDEEEAKMLNAILDELKLNALVITDPYNMRHVSGFRGGEGALYISAAQKVLITDSRYTEQAGKESDFTVIEECRGHNRHTILKECMEKENVSSDFHMGYEDQSMLCCDFDKLRKELPVQTWTEQAGKESDFTVIEECRGHNRQTILKECMEKENVSGDFHMGYEDQSMLCCDFDKLRKELPVQTWTPLGSRIDDLRQVKTKEELEYLAKAEEIGDKAFAEFLKIVKPGMTELEAAAELEYLMKKEGAEDLSFNTIIASGLNSSMPHAIPGYKKLEEGDFVTCDFGCKYKGYCSDMTRTFVLGKASDKQKEIYNVVLKAQLAGLAAVKAGVSGASVDKVARDIITEAGYGDCFGHGLGHSVGLFIHESPRLSPSDDTILKANMIETVEPGIYVPGFGGVRIEDMVVVTEDGCRNLAHSPKELIEVPVEK